MKRSEVLKIIHDVIRRELRNESILEPKLSNILIELPGDILRLVEEAGMLPPCKSIFIEYYDKQEISGIQTMLDNFKWESEDETK